MSLEDFTEGYFEGALWSSTDVNGRPLDRRFTPSDIAPETKHQMELDAGRFYAANQAGWSEEIDDSRAGYLFWLSRNGHGSGFFDEYALGPLLSKKLQIHAREAGPFDLYVDDFGQIHGSPLEQAPVEANRRRRGSKRRASKRRTSRRR